jgi:hypothetical protein
MGLFFLEMCPTAQVGENAHTELRENLCVFWLALAKENFRFMAQKQRNSLDASTVAG